MTSSTITSITKSQRTLSGFRRIQLTLALWGAIILLGGWLHNSYAKSWGSIAILLVWGGLALVGIIGSWLFSPAMVNSSSLFIWAALVGIGFLATWLIIFPLNMAGIQAISTIWHASFALGYLVTGYFMDRRLWLLALWELVWAVFMFALVMLTLFTIPDLSNNLGLTLGLSSGIPLLIAALPIWKEQNIQLKQGGLLNASGK